MNPAHSSDQGRFSFARLASFENLYEAARRAQRGKRQKPAVARFHHDLARNLVTLRDELLSGDYRPGAFHTFRISDPAPRLISAAPYRDRVVHHALCNTLSRSLSAALSRIATPTGKAKAPTARWTVVRNMCAGSAMFSKAMSGCSSHRWTMRSCWRNWLDAFGTLAYWRWPGP